MESAASPARTMIAPASTSIRRQRWISDFASCSVPRIWVNQSQGGFLLPEVLVLRDDLVLAPLQRVIQFGHDADLVGNESTGPQRLLRRGRKVHQHRSDAEIERGALDLRKAVGGRQIDAGDQLEVEHQEAAFRMPRQQRLDVLVQPVGGTEEQIALQVQTLASSGHVPSARPDRRANGPVNCDIPSRRS